MLTFIYLLVCYQLETNVKGKSVFIIFEFYVAVVACNSISSSHVGILGNVFIFSLSIFFFF